MVLQSVQISNISLRIAGGLNLNYYFFVLLCVCFTLLETLVSMKIESDDRFSFGFTLGQISAGSYGIISRLFRVSMVLWFYMIFKHEFPSLREEVCGSG